jgi:hypothetical protein
MILSGHFGGNPAAGYNQVTGVNGNKVLQVFTAYTSPVQNHLRTLKIDTAAGTVTSEVFVPLSTSPTQYPSGKIVDAASNFTVSGMAFVGSAAPQPAPQPTAPAAPTSVTATAGNASAAVSFAAPKDGGAAITSYTVKANPGGATATGTGSPITVTGLTNGTAYTFTVTATNSVGTGPASSPSGAVTPATTPAPPPPTPQLLPDGGFERSASGFIPFTTGTMTRVTSPVRSGSYAMRITATSSSYALTGMTQNTAVNGSKAGQAYTAQCYVRPSTPDLEVRIRLLQYTQDFGANVKLGTTVLTNLPVNTWTPITVTATATANGQRIIPQIYASLQTTGTGHLVYDDCTLN